jgi:hypothetical protein
MDLLLLKRVKASGPYDSAVWRDEHSLAKKVHSPRISRGVDAATDAYRVTVRTVGMRGYGLALVRRSRPAPHRAF